MSQLWRLQPGHYNNLLMRCAPGTHEAAMRLITQHVPDHPAAIDLASGSGAFLARLRDHQFADLDAVEIDRAGFRFSDLEPRALDLNGPFAGQIDRRFGLAVALEIVEHLDSPRHFLREVHTLLRRDGFLLLSTPNIANWTGRLRFTLSGEHRQFQEHDYDYQRHISPTTDTQMKLMLRETGFQLIADTTAGTFFGPLKRAVLWPIIAAARLMWGRVGVEDVRLYLAKRVEPDKQSSGSTSRYFEKTEAGR
jgi:SAM-dependent methyltransferase